MSDRATAITVPDDLPACRKLIEEQAYLVESHAQAIDVLSAKIKRLEEQKETDALRIQELLRLAFGRRSERYIEAPTN